MKNSLVTPPASSASSFSNLTRLCHGFSSLFSAFCPLCHVTCCLTCFYSLMWFGRMSAFAAGHSETFSLGEIVFVFHLALFVSSSSCPHVQTLQMSWWLEKLRASVWSSRIVMGFSLISSLSYKPRNNGLESCIFGSTEISYLQYRRTSCVARCSPSSGSSQSSLCRPGRC